MASIDPHSFSDPGQGVIARIDFRIVPEFHERLVHVQATYGLDRRVRGSFFMDCQDLRLGRIESGGRPVRWALDKQDPILGQRLHLMDLPGVDEFSIESTTGIGAAALQWLEPSLTAGGMHPFLYTQCQACSARSLFACQDTPGIRFTYEAQLSVPPPLVAVMAAEATGQEQVAGRSVYHFRMPQPIPSYLFAFAVGNFVFEPIGPRTGVYAEPETIQAAAWEFAGNEERLRAAEALFGPYLWDRYDLLIMPPVAPYGGMENPRLTFLNSCYILGDRSGGHLVSHELAHAWTGNLVTNATWEEFWLNEGPTTYAETRISEVVEGVEATRLRTAGRARRLLRDIERLGDDSPMTRLKLPLAGKSPDESYTNIPYYKGLLFFLTLEQAAGRERFDAFLRDYIETFKFRSITSEQFIAFLEERLPEVARRVDPERWIYGPGLPQGAALIRSALFDDVQEVLAAYREGTLPPPERVAGWTALHCTIFLNMLLPRVPASDCAYFENVFQIRATRDGDLRSRFFELAVHSGYREAMADYEAFFSSVGRYNFHEPVFRAMTAEDWARPLARPMLERWRHRHHAHTVAAIERILIEAGL
jgi:aminopeptidase N